MEAILSTYEFFERMNLSVTSLVVIALVFSLAFLFSVREAAAWFFKIDDLKRDLKYLNQTVLDLESEIRSLQNLVDQAKVNQPVLGLVPRAENENPESKSERSSSSGFPIVH